MFVIYKQIFYICINKTAKKHFMKPATNIYATWELRTLAQTISEYKEMNSGASAQERRDPIYLRREKLIAAMQAEVTARKTAEKDQVRERFLAGEITAQIYNGICKQRGYSF